ncbi:MAG: hypothetical protein ABWK00_02365 [Desulfurococcaceae archaeon]
MRELGIKESAMKVVELALVGVVALSTLALALAFNDLVSSLLHPKVLPSISDVGIELDGANNLWIVRIKIRNTSPFDAYVEHILVDDSPSGFKVMPSPPITLRPGESTTLVIELNASLYVQGKVIKITFVGSQGAVTIYRVLMPG